MSIEKRAGRLLSNGKRAVGYRVRFPGPDGKPDSLTFSTKKAAEAFERKWKEDRHRGLVPDYRITARTLDDLMQEFFPRWKRGKSVKTIDDNVEHYDRLVCGLRGDGRGGKIQHPMEIASIELRALTPKAIEDWRDFLLDEGVGRESLRKAMTLVQQGLDYAVREGFHGNPMRMVKKPPQGRRQKVVPPSSQMVERLRCAFLYGEKNEATALYVSLGGHGGMRPGEILALMPKHIRKDRVIVEQRISQGELLDEAKSSAWPWRTVQLPKMVVAELKGYVKKHSISANELIFPNAAGNPWTDDEYRSWRRYVYVPIADDLQLPDSHPYALRHHVASMWFKAQKSAADVAAQLGNGTDLCLKTYIHVIDQAGDERPIKDLEAYVLKQRELAEQRAARIYAQSAPSPDALAAF